jgi:hypothetical protein
MGIALPQQCKRDIALPRSKNTEATVLDVDEVTSDDDDLDEHPDIPSHLADLLPAEVAQESLGPLFATEPTTSPSGKKRGRPPITEAEHLKKQHRAERQAAAAGKQRREAFFGGRHKSVADIDQLLILTTSEKKNLPNPPAAVPKVLFLFAHRRLLSE